MGDNVELDVALLRRDSEATTQIVTKLDNAIEKLTDLGTDMKQMLVLHEQRLGRLEKIDNEIHGLVETRRAELQTDINDLEGKVASTVKEISSDINKTEDRLMTAIKGVKDDIEKDGKKKDENHDALTKRVEALEKWRYIIIGGGVAVGFIIEKVLPIFGIGSHG
jgi:chromosome segregation ATPase